MPRKLYAALGFVMSLAPIACERSTNPRPVGTTAPASTEVSIAARSAAETESEKPRSGHGGEVIELGEVTQDGMTVKASRDAGEIVPGQDAPIDIWIDGGLGGAAAVRFWIGTQDAKGSIKAKAGVEAGHWHTHGEVPEPLPADSRLWVEIEHKDGTSTLVSFELRA